MFLGDFSENCLKKGQNSNMYFCIKTLKLDSIPTIRYKMT